MSNYIGYIGYISGYSNAREINYCPCCGSGIGTWIADGTAYCDECDCRFGVVEFPKEDEEEGQHYWAARRGGAE